MLRQLGFSWDRSAALYLSASRFPVANGHPRQDNSSWRGFFCHACRSVVTSCPPSTSLSPTDPPGIRMESNYGKTTRSSSMVKAAGGHRFQAPETIQVRCRWHRCATRLARNTRVQADADCRLAPRSAPDQGCCRRHKKKDRQIGGDRKRGTAFISRSIAQGKPSKNLSPEMVRPGAWKSSVPGLTVRGPSAALAYPEFFRPSVKWWPRLAIASGTGPEFTSSVLRTCEFMDL